MASKAKISWADIATLNSKHPVYVRLRVMTLFMGVDFAEWELCPVGSIAAET